MKNQADDLIAQFQSREALSEEICRDVKEALESIGRPCTSHEIAQRLAPKWNGPRLSELLRANAPNGEALLAGQPEETDAFVDRLLDAIDDGDDGTWLIEKLLVADLPRDGDGRKLVLLLHRLARRIHDARVRWVTRLVGLQCGTAEIARLTKPAKDLLNYLGQVLRIILRQGGQR